MQRNSHPFAVVVVLALLIVTAACGTVPASAPVVPPAPTMLESLAVPLAATPYPPPPSPPSFPTATREPTWTPYTPPPPQTLTPTPVPTVTPLPTALPLPPAAFDVLWLENLPGPGVDDATGVIWRADPRDVANRREVARFNGQTVERAALSPNGRYVALVTKGRLEGGGPLWVMNLDGTDLRQLAPLARYILWSPDSLTIFYKVDESGGEAIERVDLKDGKTQRILTIEPFTSLQLVGWAPGGQWLYYIRTRSEYELWKVRQDGSDPQVITSLEIGYPPVPALLSPRGSRLLVGIHWLSLNNQGKGDIQLPRSVRNGQILWDEGAAEDNSVIVGQIEQGVSYLYTVHIPSQRAQELARLTMPVGPWYQLSLSLDRQWLVAHIYHSGFYWVHLPTGTVVAVSPYDSSTQFIAWVPKGPGQ